MQASRLSRRYGTALFMEAGRACDFIWSNVRDPLQHAGDGL
jgi:hypothetical protein